MPLGDRAIGASRICGPMNLMTERPESEAERRELEKFLDAIERTPMNTGRGPGLRRTDLTPMGCAANILLFGGFAVTCFKPLVGVPMAFLGFPLYFWADARRRRKRLADAERALAGAPAVRPGRDAAPAGPESTLP